LVVLALFGLSTPPAYAQGKCAPLSGTITAQLDFQQGAWVGQAYLAFGKNPPVIATIVDRSLGYKAHPSFKPDGSGNIAGDEELTFTIKDSPDWFIMTGKFVGIAGTTPYFYGFSETGKVTSGGGQFDDLTGNISIHGSFVVPAGALPTDPPLGPFVWVAQMTGSVCRQK
jgi:hypothetical protein